MSAKGERVRQKIVKISNLAVTNKGLLLHTVLDSFFFFFSEDGTLLSLVFLSFDQSKLYAVQIK